MFSTSTETKEDTITSKTETVATKTDEEPAISKMETTDTITINKEHYYGTKEGYEICKEKLDKIRDIINYVKPPKEGISFENEPSLLGMYFEKEEKLIAIESILERKE